jgi:hypothetical protein
MLRMHVRLKAVVVERQLVTMGQIKSIRQARPRTFS